MAMLFVPAMKIFSMWFHGKEFALVTGLFVSSGGVGSLLATTPLAVLTEWLGWRSSFVYAGIFTLIIAILAFVVVVDKPSSSTTAPRELHKNEPQADNMWSSLLSVLKQPVFWPLAVWFFFGNGLFFTFASLWGGPYLEGIYQLGKADAGNILSMIAIGIIIGGALLSTLSNQLFAARRKPVMILSALMILALFGTLKIFTTSLTLPMLYAIYLLFGIFGNGIVAIGFTMTKETFPLRVSGTALGLVNVFGWLGVAILQPVVGLLLENYNNLDPQIRYGYVFMGLLSLSSITLIASLLVRETGAYASSSEPTALNTR